MRRTDLEYFGPAPREPITSAGTALRDMVRRASWDDVSKLPEAASEIIDQLFVTAVRRRFAEGLSDDTVAGFVRGALPSADAGSAADAIAIVAAVLGTGGDVSDLDKRYLAGLIIALLRQLQRDGVINDRAADALVVTAEARAVRLLRKRTDRLLWWLDRGARLGRSFMRQYQSHNWPANSGFIPETVIGQKLKAIARFDFAKRDRLPADPNDVGVIEVVDVAFSSVLRGRFDPARGPTVVSEVGARIATTSGVKHDIRVIEEVIRATMGGAPSGVKIPRADDIYIKIIGFARLVDDLGLYDSELDDVLLEAERLAASRERAATPMPSVYPHFRLKRV